MKRLLKPNKIQMFNNFMIFRHISDLFLANWEATFIKCDYTIYANECNRIHTQM